MEFPPIALNSNVMSRKAQSLVQFFSYFIRMVFADDTNLTAVECAISEIEEDLLNISNWLNANKLVIIHEKIVQLSFQPGLPTLGTNKSK